MKKTILSSLIGLIISNVALIAYANPANLATNVVGQSKQTSDVPTKVIEIYNNSSIPIYPVIETSMTAKDEWLQAAFQVTDVNRDTFSHTKLYRIYVNPVHGIPAHGSVSITLPFYSDLVKHPVANMPDQYINWWNGGRVYLYDNQAKLQSTHDLDKINPVFLKTAAPTCPNCEPLNIFSSNVGLSLGGPYQLAEYTFANVTTNVTPYQIDPNYVDYDLSYVDHVYLPVALEPYENNTIGYTGTVMDVDSFRNKINTFLNNESGWPVFKQSDEKKVPGTYNVLVLNGTGELTTEGPSISKMKNLWHNCLISGHAASHSQDCKNIQTVNDLFLKNYAQYKAMCSSPVPDQPTEASLLQHVYGWVPFNECPRFAPGDNSLYHTPGVDYNAAKMAYDDLEYSQDGVFNPYVHFIHAPNQLNMQAYAYSVDDAVGNMNEQGNGIVIAIGGSNGLPNPNEYDAKALIRVNLGAPSAGGPSWTKYGICSKDATEMLKPDSLSFQLGSVTYPCEVSLQDSSNRVYHFTVSHAAPLKQEDRVCAVGDEWCNSINVDPNTRQDVNTPPPATAASQPTNTATLYWAPEWESINGCGINSNVAPGAQTLSGFGTAAGSCNVNLNAAGRNATLAVAHDAQGNVTNVNCTVNATGKACFTPPSVSASVVNIATPAGLVGY